MGHSAQSGNLMMLLRCRVLCLVALVASASACDMNGDWIFFQGTSYPGTTSSAVTVTQTGLSLNVVVAPIQGRDSSKPAFNDTEKWSGSITASGDYLTVLIQRVSDGKVLSGTVANPACNRVCFNCTQTPKGPGSGLVWRRVNKQTTHVHLVFMTHLDVGYTMDTSEQVLGQYFSEWFPKAYATAQALSQRGGEESFAWTTHPWLINRYMANATGNVTTEEIEALGEAINGDVIRWHAGPMNMEAEVSERYLFDFGLSLAHELDAKFNKSKKIGMSQKDVPGTTIGIVELMYQRGIRSLHVGVNDFSTTPAVPDHSPAMYAPCIPFMWRDDQPNTLVNNYNNNNNNNNNKGKNKEVAQILAFWCSGYGEGYGDYSGLVPEMSVSLPALSDGSLHELTYLMRVDNTGPQSPDEVIEGWKNVRLLYPQAKIVLSSLDEFTTLALSPEVVQSLPVVTSEMGDTWIRGAASDPTKIRQYRAAARVIASALIHGTISPADPRVHECLSNLIKLPEHTYGSNDGLVWNWPYDNPTFDSLVNSDAYNRTVLGFLEQRGYITKATAALADLPLRAVVDKAIADSEPVSADGRPKHDGPEWEEIVLPFKGVCGDVEIGFDVMGAVNVLVFQDRSWAGDNNTLGLFQYRSHSEQEFDAFGAKYMLPGCRAEQDCGLCGFGKCGLSSVAQAETKTWLPRVSSAFHSPATCEFHLGLVFDDPEALLKYGAPDSVNVTYRVLSQTAAAAGGGGGGDSANATVQIDVQYHKRPTRMAESVWMSFAPLVDPHTWRLDKLGRLVDPFDVVVNGSRWAHAVWSGVYSIETTTQSQPNSKQQTQKHHQQHQHHHQQQQQQQQQTHRRPLQSLTPDPTASALTPTASLALCSLDAAVVMLDEPTPILFLRDETISGRSMHFNLFNNAWNTNFPVWLLDPLQRFQFDVVVGNSVTPVTCVRSQ